MRLNTELTHANILGTTRYNLNIGEYMDDEGKFELPRIYARVGHQVSTGWRPISSFNLSFAYSNPEENRRDNRHRYSLSASLSGRVGLMSWSSSASGTLYSDDLDAFSWSWANTASFSFSRYFWLSASLTLSGNGFNVPRVYGRIYATVRFGQGSASASTSFNDVSLSVNAYSDKHSFSANASSRDIVNINGYNASADYSYKGRWVDLSLGASADYGFRDGNADFSISTSTLFADGMFYAGAYIPENFLLVRQYDALKGNTLSSGSVGSSEMTVLDSLFGTSMHTGISRTRGTSFTLYSTSDDSFNGPSMFDINVPASSEMGYVLRLRADVKYSVSGIVVLPDGNPWINGSSPLYRYSVVDNQIVLEPTENYVFTDNNGRFIVSDLVAGTYAFDVQLGRDWILAVFEAIEDEDSGNGVQIVTQNTVEIHPILPEPYVSMVSYSLDDVLSSDDFWYMLYPEMREVAI